MEKLMLLRLSLFTVLAVPFTCFAANREMQELQRDVAQLQEQMRTLQRSFDEKITALTVQVQQTLEASNKANTALAVLDGGLRTTLRDQEKGLLAPVANVGAKVDQMTGEFQDLKETIKDLTARMGKMQQQILDLSNAVKVMQAPPAPPGASASQPTVSGVILPQIPADTLFQNAQKDRSGGKADLAVEEFAQYLKSYGNTDLAPEAQFQIGDIHYTQRNYDAALKDFDQVLQQYPDSNKVPDALYMKGLTLIKLDRRNDGVREFRTLIQQYPRSERSTQARARLKEMGLSPTPPPPKRR
jgi:tol-pal system protein YbgF